MIETTFVKQYSKILCDMVANEWEVFDTLDDPEQLANMVIDYLRYG